MYRCINRSNFFVDDDDDAFDGMTCEMVVGEEDVADEAAVVVEAACEMESDAIQIKVAMEKINVA